jgi:hypothetical protein
MSTSLAARLSSTVALERRCLPPLRLQLRLRSALCTPTSGEEDPDLDCTCCGSVLSSLLLPGGWFPMEPPPPPPLVVLVLVLVRWFTGETIDERTYSRITAPVSVDSICAVESYR